MKVYVLVYHRNFSRVLSTTQAARDMGIERLDVLDVGWARRKFPDLEILVLPDNKWGKPESQSKRLSSFRVMDIVKEFASERGGFKIEMNSLDDMFLDISSLVAHYGRKGFDLDDFGISKLSRNMFLETSSGTYDSVYIRSQFENGFKSDEERHLIMGAVVAQELAHKVIWNTGFKVRFNDAGSGGGSLN